MNTPILGLHAYFKLKVKSNVPITDYGIHSMTRSTKTPQLHLLAATCDLARVAVAPLHRHVRVSVRVDEHVERAPTAVELWQEGH